ncbi:hypothetical protein O181_005369 [Austropuccinia psidii MF-1]|uniref:Uncharacterized protein n=1 Tax=Austropuccinia psidii MF-1 TaxID=1389203 RepID=A0A9Q3GFT7_9BASI|nr:hypothetical protein [Austropuccinia psidii MF-1]
MKGAAHSRRGGTRSRLGEEEEAEEEGSYQTEVTDGLENSPRDPEAPNLDLYNECLVPQDKPILHKMMEKITQLMDSSLKQLPQGTHPST